jgi:predicted phage terminase large subunit-like protein
MSEGQILNRAEMHETYGTLLTDARKRKQEAAVLRALCRRDLFFLLVYVCGRTDLDDDFHFARSRDIMAEPDGMMDVWCREHGKSSMVTFGKSLQDILVNQEERICIFSHTKTVASDHLQPIKYEMEENNKLKKLFPDILYANPSKQSPKWTEDAIQVKRRGNYVENTVEASGLIDALRTGMHHTILVWDDVLNEKNVTNPEMITKTMEAVNSSTNLTCRGYRKRGVGTYYHFNDPYVQMIARGILRERLFPGTSDGTVTGAPVWWTPEQLADRRKTLTPYQFACQVLCNPKMESKYGFEDSWLQYWSTAKTHCWRGMNVLIFVDPANEKKKSSDYTVFVVVGLSADQNVYVIEWIRDRLSLDQRTDKLFELHRKYNKNRELKKVYYEKYGKDSDIPHIESVMKLENYRFHIDSVGGNVDKNDRINWIVPMWKEGNIYIPEECYYRTTEGKQQDLTQIFINEEYRLWPFGSHDDMLDSLARIKSEEVHLPFPDMNQANVGYQPAGQPRESQDGGYNPLRHHREGNLRAA